jgi:hypothetical protein
VRGRRDERLDVVEVVRDEQARERQVRERGFTGPGAQLTRDAAVLETGAVGGDDLIEVAQDHRDVRCFLFRSDRAQVAEVPQVAAYPLDRGQRLARETFELGALPRVDDVTAAFDGQSVAEVVGDDDAEPREKGVFEIVGEIDEPVVDGEPVVHVAEEDELAGCATFIRERELARPGWRGLRGRHRRSSEPIPGPGASRPRPSTAPPPPVPPRP